MCRLNRLRVFKTRVLRYIIRSKREELTGQWKKLHCERFYELYLTTIITREIKLKMSWTSRVAHKGEKRGVYRVWSGNLRRDHLEELIVNESIILRWILKELVGMTWTGLFWFRIGKIDELL
jgi:hypothetical protein